jgi:1,4-alpha-glucan branching enzyme
VKNRDPKEPTEKQAARPEKETAKTTEAGNGSRITAHDIYLFKEGSHFNLYRKLGAHTVEVDGVTGVHFAVWAPDAAHISVIGDWNHWQRGGNELAPRADSSGIWEGFVPSITNGAVYKYHIASRYNGYNVEKADPMALVSEMPPKTASIVHTLGDYKWDDSDWMARRAKHNALDAPYSVYEVHLGSWRRNSDENNRYLSYKEQAVELTAYVKEMGFTHVELMPIMTHPFYGSWGYQSLGYFSPTARYGSPEELMYLIDTLHQNGIGVILDWVPSHFPTDEHGLGYFDGTHLYEHADPQKGFHPDWKSSIFNYSRNEVRSFLISSALFWLDQYHIDGLRVDAVASMLYLDYSREEGEWIPNEFGGRENLEAISFIRRLNEAVYEAHPDVQTIAEESTDWPMVSRPTHIGGLGFGMKWNMGWMHDTLAYMKKDPVHRKYYHNQLGFSIWYAFTENFMLPFSHDEVVHGKGSMIGKMPGDEWQKFANLRALYGYMYGHPGKKLLFMGCEFGQVGEWAHEKSLDWHVLKYPVHGGLQRLVRDLNFLYKTEPALFEVDFANNGFEWIDYCNGEQSVLSFLRKGKSTDDIFLVISNFTPMVREDYIVGVPRGGFWEEVINTDSSVYAGSGVGNLGGVTATGRAWNDRPNSLQIILPPLSTVIFKSKG